MAITNAARVRGDQEFEHLTHKRGQWVYLGTILASVIGQLPNSQLWVAEEKLQADIELIKLADKK